MPSILQTSTSYRSLGSLMMGLIPDPAFVKGNIQGMMNPDMDAAQKDDLFHKYHIMEMGASSMDPQRDWMYILYIRDVRGRYWNDIGLSYANMYQQLVSNLYGISNGSIKTALYKGTMDLIQNLGKMGTSSAQQELVYRCDNVTLPSRVIEKSTSNFMGVKCNFPTNVSYEGQLSVTFEEGEDQFILRQMNSWMSIVDEWGAGGFSNTAPSTLKLPKPSLTKVSPTNSDSIVESSLAHNIKTNIELYMLRYCGDDSAYKITFYGCYPANIGAAQLSYSGNALLKYSVNFDYDYFKVEYIKAPIKPQTTQFKGAVATAIDEILQQIANALYTLIFRAILKNTTKKWLSNPTNKPVSGINIEGIIPSGSQHALDREKHIQILGNSSSNEITTPLMPDMAKSLDTLKSKIAEKNGVISNNTIYKDNLNKRKEEGAEFRKELVGPNLIDTLKNKLTVNYNLHTVDIHNWWRYKFEHLVTPPTLIKTHNWNESRIKRDGSKYDEEKHNWKGSRIERDASKYDEETHDWLGSRVKGDATVFQTKKQDWPLGSGKADEVIVNLSDKTGV